MSTSLDGSVSLDARAFRFVNMPEGAILIFPVSPLSQKKREGERSAEIRSITLEEIRSERRDIGFKTRNGVTLELERKGFRRIRDTLRGRDLRATPINFTLKLDDDGSVLDVKIDGEDMCSRQDRDSGFVPKEGEAPLKPSKAR